MKHSSLKIKLILVNLVFFVVIYQAFVFPSYGYDNQKSEDKDAIALANTLTERSREFGSTLSGLKMIKPEDLGLKVKRGQIDYKSMTKAQQDTIVIAMFNPEDNYLDIAVFYKSRNEIVIYLNQANGRLVEYNHISYKSDNVERIEAFIDKKPNEFVPPFVKCSLKIIYTDKTQRTISGNTINKQSMLESGGDNTFFSMFDLPRNTVMSLDFLQIWSHSENTHNAIGYHSAVDDIDNDGKTEIVYTYYITNSSPYPSKIVVFKSLGNSQFVVEWDSLFTNSAFVMNNQTIDFDNNGFKEVFLAAYSPLTQRVSAGLLEKNIYGFYRYYYTGLDWMGYPYQSVELRDTMRLGVYDRKGMWICSSINDQTQQTIIQRAVYNGHRDNIGYGFYGDGNSIILDWFIYDMKVFDMDGDGKEEILLGDTQFGTSYFGYLDSTGVGTNLGYEYKHVLPNEPLAAGYIFQKDYDNDGIKEFYLAGPGEGTGCIGVVKHTGAPGSDNYSVVWWDSTGIVGAPINGMDSGYVDGRYSFVHPALRYIGGTYARRHLYVFTRDGMYNFIKTFYISTDSVVNIQPHLTDVEHTGKAYIVAPQSAGYFGHLENFIAVYKQNGTIGINNPVVSVPKDYVLYQNYPNPFNPTTKIKFEIPKSGLVTLKVYDITGREIQILINEVKKAGSYDVLFNASNLASGVFFYRIQSNDNVMTKRMVLIK
jgi:Secretion system C-terminal sorting domain